MSFLTDFDAAPPDNLLAQFGVLFRYLATDWRGMFRELRTIRPVCATPKLAIVTRWAEVVQVLSQHQLFSVRRYAEKMDPSVGPFMLGRDETPTNWDEKSVMRSLLHTDDDVRVRAMVASVAAKSLAASGPLELVSRVGRLVPLRIVQWYFGFPGPDDATMLRWSRATQFDMFRNPTNDATVHEANIQAGAEMRAHLRIFLSEVMKACVKMEDAVNAYAAYSANPASKPNPVAKPCLPETVVARLMRLAHTGQASMGFERLVSNVCGLLVGAIETTSQAIVQAAEQILLRPPAELCKALSLAKCADAEFDALVWEALRFNPIAPMVMRVCERDTSLAGVAIAKGAVVAACTGSAMFDAAEFPEPETFKWPRPFDSYLHFGFGHHECLGKYVGKVAIPEAVRQILLVPGIKLDKPIATGPGGFPESFVVGRT